MPAVKITQVERVRGKFEPNWATPKPKLSTNMLSLGTPQTSGERRTCKPATSARVRVLTQSDTNNGIGRAPKRGAGQDFNVELISEQGSMETQQEVRKNSRWGELGRV